MYRRLYLLLTLVALLWAIPAAVRAQDVLVDLNGNELTGQIIEITPTDVLYRAADADPTLPPSIVPKNTLFMVRFANGTKEVFGQAAPALPPTVPGAVTPSPAAPAQGLTLVQLEELRQRGRQDAYRYYNRTGPFLGSMFGAALAGFVPPLIIGLVRPKAHKNKSLNPQMLRYPAYVAGYEQAARKRKVWPVIGGFLAGAVISGLISSAAQ